MLSRGLAAVFLVLLVLRRRLSEAVVPLIPIALATGWSALVLFALRIPLNPMSATLGALVIAISTEFSVLLSARYRQEREAKADTVRALERAYSSTGAAVLASGATAIAGFAAVIASDIRMLHDFGAVTVIDLTVSLPRRAAGAARRDRVGRAARARARIRPRSAAARAGGVGPARASGHGRPDAPCLRHCPRPAHVWRRRMRACPRPRTPAMRCIARGSCVLGSHAPASTSRTRGVLPCLRDLRTASATSASRGLGRAPASGWPTSTAPIPSVPRRRGAASPAGVTCGWSAWPA